VNALLFIADALRYDTLFDSASSMPRLRKRFATWQPLPWYYSSAPWTLPACTSLLTATEPATHEHFSHAHQLAQETLTAKFGGDRITAAFVNNRALDRNSGLFGDFDEYELIADHDATFARAHRFLDERDQDGRPYFLVVHSNIVHDYYLPVARRYYEGHAGDGADFFALGQRVIAWRGLDEAERATVRRIYTACAAALDERVDGLLDRLGPETATCFVSDHGEGLEPEIARVHHGGRLHDDLLRVPCVFKLPDGTPPRARQALAQAADGPVTATDVLPTLLDAVGSAVANGLGGQSLLNSDRDVNGRRVAAEDRRYLYMRNRHRLNLNARGKNMSLGARLRNRVFRSTIATQFGIRTEIEDGHKLTETQYVARNALMLRLGRRALRKAHTGDPLVVTEGRRWRGFELVDLRTDPGERINLLQQSSKVSGRLSE
jgi:hypothetical protein